MSGATLRQHFILDSTGNLVNPATSDIQTDGTQLTQILVDIGGVPTLVNATINDDRSINLDGLAGINVNSMNFGRIDDSTVKNIRLDGVSESQTTITNAHHEIHDGDTFRCFSTKDVANGGTYSISFTTPNTTEWLHFTIGLEHELEGHFTLYENITSFTDGTPRPIVNANRNSAGVSGVTNMVSDATVVVGTPTILIDEHGGSGKKFGGASNHDAEWILKQNTRYLLLFTNFGAGENNVNLQLDWYEHTNRN